MELPKGIIKKIQPGSNTLISANPGESINFYAQLLHDRAFMYAFSEGIEYVIGEFDGIKLIASHNNKITTNQILSYFKIQKYLQNMPQQGVEKINQEINLANEIEDIMQILKSMLEKSEKGQNIYWEHTPPLGANYKCYLPANADITFSELMDFINYTIELKIHNCKLLDLENQTAIKIAQTLSSI